jgi:putative transcriptional regulator
MKVESLRGQLLISSAGLFDPNFRHTVVLVGAHDANGALGVISNRPLQATVEEMVPALAALVAPGELVFRGGPVQPDQPVVLAEVAHPELADLLVFGAVGFLTGDVPSDIRPGVLRARVFAGYAGWGAGQLEAELESGSWIVEPATADDVFSNAPETLWRRILERKGPPYAALARVPFDPSMN